jgi:hypothetical protein
MIVHVLPSSVLPAAWKQECDEINVTVYEEGAGKTQ